jgi:hypothetical protein
MWGDVDGCEGGEKDFPDSLRQGFQNAKNLRQVQKPFEVSWDFSNKII